MLAKLNDISLIGIDEIEISKTEGLDADTFLVPFLLSEVPAIKNEGPTFGIPGGRNTVTLTIGSRTLVDLRIRVIKKAKFSGEATPFCILIITDRRYYWARKLLSAAYNIKRRIGKVIENATATVTPDVSKNLLDAYEYRTSTIRGETLVTVREAFVDQMERLGEVLNTSFELPDDFGTQILAPMEFTGSGIEMLSRILEQASDFSLSMGDDGIIRLYKLSNVDKAKISLTSIFPALDGATNLMDIDMSHERPEYIDVFWDVEQELLFRHLEAYDETDPTEGRKTLANYNTITVDGTPIPYLECVVRNPIRNFNLLFGNFIAEGTRLRLSTFFAKLTQITLPPYNTYGHPTYQLWREIYLRPWEKSPEYLSGILSSDEQWMPIVEAIDNAFRKQFRCVKPWWDLFLTVIPRRAALVNDFDLTRAYAPVFCDYLLFPSYRLVTEIDSSRYINFGFKVLGNHTDPDLRKISPGRIEVEDPDAGVFSVNFLAETRGEYKRVIPGAIEAFGTSIDAGSAFLDLSVGQSLEANWGLSTIMTAIPYYKRNKTHLFRVRIRPSDAEKRLSQPIGNCFGPPIEVYIPYSETMAARFMWADDAPDKCIAPFIDENAEFDPTLLTNIGMLLDTSEATAAAIYAPLLDHVEGTIVTTGDHKPVNFIGNIKTLTTIASAAGVLTGYSAQTDAQIRDPESFMSDETLATLRRLKII